MLLELATTAIDDPVRPPTPERLADLEARIRRAVAQGRSETTRRAYATDRAAMSKITRHLAGIGQAENATQAETRSRSTDATRW